LSEIEQFSAELLIINQIFVVIMSRYDLDLWLLDLERVYLIGVKCSNSVRNLSEIEQSPA